MKFNRTYIFIATSSVALAMLLLIQINWIIQTAKVKEELFNEKALMVLSRTTQELCSDKETCMNMENCGFVDGKSGCKLDLGKNEIHKIDSLLKKFIPSTTFISIILLKSFLRIKYSLKKRFEVGVIIFLRLVWKKYSIIMD